MSEESLWNPIYTPMHPKRTLKTPPIISDKISFLKLSIITCFNWLKVDHKLYYINADGFGLSEKINIK